MANPSDYAVLQVARTPDVARFAFHGFVDLKTGYSTSHGLNFVAPVSLPASAVVKPDPSDRHPGADRVTPVLAIDDAFVVSSAIKEVFESLGMTDVEFLPIPVLDKRAKPLPDAYFIVHPLREIDAIDKERSKLTFALTNTEYIIGVESLVLRPEALPERLLCFRLRYLRRRLVVHLSLVDALARLRQQAFTYALLSDYREFAGSLLNETTTAYDVPTKAPRGKPDPSRKNTAQLPARLEPSLGRKDARAETTTSRPPAKMAKKPKAPKKAKAKAPKKAKARSKAGATPKRRSSRAR